jgi:hypothetical protein
VRKKFRRKGKISVYGARWGIQAGNALRGAGNKGRIEPCIPFPAARRRGKIAKDG